MTTDIKTADMHSVRYSDSSEEFLVPSRGNDVACAHSLERAALVVKQYVQGRIALGSVGGGQEADLALLFELPTTGTITATIVARSL